MADGEEDRARRYRPCAAVYGVNNKTATIGGRKEKGGASAPPFFITLFKPGECFDRV